MRVLPEHPNVAHTVLAWLTAVVALFFLLRVLSLHSDLRLLSSSTDSVLRSDHLPAGVDPSSESALMRSVVIGAYSVLQQILELARIYFAYLFPIAILAALTAPAAPRGRRSLLLPVTALAIIAAATAGDRLVGSRIDALQSSDQSTSGLIEATGPAVAWAWVVFAATAGSLAAMTVLSIHSWQSSRRLARL
jgi:hypothetical protein